MASRPYSYRYPYDIQTTLEPWRARLGLEFDAVVKLLEDRDRALEDYLSFGIGQGYLATATITANQAGLTAAATDIVGLSDTVTVPEHRRLKITVHGRLQNNGAGTAVGNLIVQEDGVDIGQRIAILQTTGALGDAQDMDFSVFVNPTGGQHTYKVRASVSSGSGTFIAFATNPGYITVEDIGSV